MAYNALIFGYGVVGNALHRLLDNHANVYIEDRALGFKVNGYDIEGFRESDIAVICINAPENEVGYDATGIAGILSRLYELKFKGLICIKTTILPLQVETLISTYRELNICAWPEFLNNDTADIDIFNTNQLFGGNYNQMKILQNILPNCNFHRVSPKEAFQIKILWNLYGATKVTFWHSIQNSGFANIPSLKPKWDAWVKANPQGDLNIIAKDGKQGFGGKCYPKELNAFLAVFKSNLLKTIKGLNVWFRNQK